VIHKVLAFIYRIKNQQPEVLIFEHDITKVHQMVRGTVEPGEDLELAVKREVEEEAGLNDLQFLGKLGERVVLKNGGPNGQGPWEQQLHHAFILKTNDETKDKWTQQPIGSAEEELVKFHFFWEDLAKNIEDKVYQDFSYFLPSLRDHIAALELCLETERTVLKLPRLGEEAETLFFYQNNKEHLAPWDPKTPEGFYTIDYWRLKNEQPVKEFIKSQTVRFNIYHQENNQLIGMVNFSGLERGPFQNCRVGYKIDSQFQGQGLMKEALSKAIEYMFQEQKFHRVEANYIPHNERSGNVLKSLGFEEHGRATQYLHIDGKWQDHILTSKINGNWRC
jgi:ribosomal-protein-alanine N-acetyltransferase